EPPRRAAVLVRGGEAPHKLTRRPENRRSPQSAQQGDYRRQRVEQRSARGRRGRQPVHQALESFALRQVARQRQNLLTTLRPLRRYRALPLFGRDIEGNSAQLGYV